MKSFDVVNAFEKRVASFAGSRFAVATMTGTAALFLSLQYEKNTSPYKGPIYIPCHTFISVPMACLQAGFELRLEDMGWKGIYYLNPFSIVDGALRFRRGMYRGGLHCLSFQARKILNIGEGGMILTDNEDAYDWLKKARYSGRGAPDFSIEDVDMMGWQLYMTPEKAARGLHLMDYVGDGEKDQVVNYPDLRKCKFFKDNLCITAEKSLAYRSPVGFTNSPISPVM